jgi:hypothetical protein
MQYKAYSNSKTTPNRRTRKGDRNTTFRYNKSLRAKVNRERRAQREQDNG